MLFRRIKYIVLSFLVLLFLFCLACKKDKEEDEVPVKYIDIYIYPNSTMYADLNSVGGWLYLSDGVGGNGVLVYRRMTDEFMAYDRTCPHDPSVDGAQITVDTSGVTTYCPICSSKFILIDGSPYHGPATTSLRQYRTAYDGNTLHIFN